jgi:hypothetical protein
MAWGCTKSKVKLIEKTAVPIFAPVTLGVNAREKQRDG